MLPPSIDEVHEDSIRVRAPLEMQYRYRFHSLRRWCVYSFQTQTVCGRWQMDGRGDLHCVARTGVDCHRRHTDMRCGMNSLALLVQKAFRRDPHGGDLYVFRGKSGKLVEILRSGGDTPAQLARFSRVVTAARLNEVAGLSVLPDLRSELSEDLVSDRLGAVTQTGSLQLVRRACECCRCSRQVQMRCGLCPAHPSNRVHGQF